MSNLIERLRLGSIDDDLLDAAKEAADTIEGMQRENAELRKLKGAEPVAVALRFAGDERLCLSTVFDTREEAQHYADTCAKSKAVTVPLYAAPQAPAPLTDDFIYKVVRSQQPHLDDKCKVWAEIWDECEYWLKAAQGITGEAQG